jgi:hypothetical protein
LMISLMRGTPRVTFMDATPAKWNVFSVICVSEWVITKGQDAGRGGGEALMLSDARMLHVVSDCCCWPAGRHVCQVHMSRA